jgi:3-oxoacyl-[acyl-carrier protein] reductase
MSTSEQVAIVLVRRAASARKSRANSPGRLPGRRQLCRERRPAREVVDAIVADGGQAIAVRRTSPIRPPSPRCSTRPRRCLRRDRRGGELGGRDEARGDRRVRRCGVRRHVRDQREGTFNVCRAAAQRVRDGGRIVNLSTSVIGCMPATGSRRGGGVESMTQVLARKCAGRGIRVNAVAAGTGRDRVVPAGKSPGLSIGSRS